MILLAGVVLLAVGLACSCPLSERLSQRLAAEPSATPAPTKTPRPTFTATPNWTPTPTITPTPTNTPIPTDTPTPVPTDTPTPVPPTATFTPAPPTATFTPTSSRTPSPTRTRTPRPTATMKPTRTPVPTSTPVQTPKPLAPVASRYFPLEAGRVYMYRWSNSVYHPDALVETLTVSRQGVFYSFDARHAEAEGEFRIEKRTDSLWWGSWGTRGRTPYPIPLYMILSYTIRPTNFLVEPLTPGHSWQGVDNYGFDEDHPAYTSVSTVEADGDTVTVPASTYENCLRVRTDYDSEHSYRAGSRVMWFARDVGLVKLVFNHRDGSVTTAELQSIQ